jgi:hypothetical protein
MLNPLTETPLATYLGGPLNRNQYEWAMQIMRIVYFVSFPETTNSFGKPGRP